MLQRLLISCAAIFFILGSENARAQCSGGDSNYVPRYLSLQRNVERAEYRLAEAQVADYDAEARLFVAREQNPDARGYGFPGGEDYEKWESLVRPALNAWIDAQDRLRIARIDAERAREQFAIFCRTEDGPGRNHDRDGSTGR
jgi:hypothetical protein